MHLGYPRRIKTIEALTERLHEFLEWLQQLVIHGYGEIEPRPPHASLAGEPSQNPSQRPSQIFPRPVKIPSQISLGNVQSNALISLYQPNLIQANPIYPHPAPSTNTPQRTVVIWREVTPVMFDSSDGSYEQWVNHEVILNPITLTRFLSRHTSPPPPIPTHTHLNYIIAPHPNPAALHPVVTYPILL